MRFLLPLSILLFWMTTSALLVLKVYFPDESRFPKVEREFVADLFFGKGRNSDLAILKDGKAYGRVSITPRPLKAIAPNGVESEDLREVFFIGYLLEQKEELPLGQLAWNGSLYVNRGFEAKALRLQLRLPAFGLAALATVTLDPPDFQYKLKQGQEVVMDSADPEKSEQTMAQLQMLARLQGQNLDPSIFSGDKQQLLGLLESFEPEVDCRHGRFEILDDSYDGYLVTLKFIEDFKLRFYISELGELLKVDGMPGVVILGEAFVSTDELAPGVE